MRKRIIEFVVLLMVAAGAGPVGAAIWQWSLTAGSNATADPSINWSENQAPSSVNDSARAMMSVIAAWRNDVSATNTSAGTSTAYTLTTSEGVNTTPASGQMLAFIAHATNGAAPTLTVDGGNTYPLWLNGATVPSGTMLVGTPYRVAFNTSNSAWLLEAGYGSPFTIPLGGILWSTAPTAPNSNFVAPSGQCISTTTYATYWVQQGSPASGACPGGQFAIIDMRGRVAAALDTLNASAAGRMTNAATGCGTALTSVGAVCANGTQSHTMTVAEMPSHNHTISDPGHSHNYTSASSTTIGDFFYRGSVNSTVLPSSTSTTGITINNAGGGTAFPKVQPTIGLIPYLRIL